MTRNHIGVDLSKDTLDICDPRRGETRIANVSRAIAAWLADLGPDDVIVYEATSVCDRSLRLALRGADHSGVRLNPLHAWHFARSLNLPKTDRVDAAMLARLGAERQPAPDAALDPVRDELRALVQRRDQLKRMEVEPPLRLHASRRREGHPFPTRQPLPPPRAHRGNDHRSSDPPSGA
jgi:transposase